MDELAGKDRKRVEADVMLNCDKNIFVLFRNGDKSGLSIKPPICQGINDTRICANRHPPSTAPPILATEDADPKTNELLIFIGAAVGAIFLVLIVGGVLLRQKLRKQKPDPEPDVEKTVKVADEEKAVEVTKVVPLPRAKPKSLAGVIYELRTVDISGGHMKHWDKMLRVPQGQSERVDGLYDLVPEGFALRIDRTQLNPFEGEDNPPVVERAVELKKEAVIPSPVKTAQKDTASQSKKNETKELKQLPRPPPMYCYAKKDFDAATARDATTVATEIINKLGSERWLSESDYLPSYTPNPDDLRVLCEHLTPIMKAYKGVARPSGKSIVVGDLHGNFNDLWRIIHAWLSDQTGGGSGQNIIFLGDVVDRGLRQIECWTLLLAYKTLYPNQVYIIRGNHEEVQTCESFNIWLGLRRYADEVRNGIYELFVWLPVIGLIDDRILCVHGMITPTLSKKFLREGWDLTNKRLKEMNRNLRWNDPGPTTDLYARNAGRGCGYLCGPKAINEALERLGVEFIIRGHQYMTNGVHRFLDLPLVTVFSSSFYGSPAIEGVPPTSMMKNFGAVLYVDPGKNAIKPIFHVNINDSITTQQQFNDKLEEGWKKDDYEEKKNDDKTICLSPTSSGDKSSSSVKKSKE
ncbi:unnamed protein product, partial [Mesorhabditis spiculigera]